MCRHACPVATASGRETLIPQAKMARLNTLRKGEAAWTAESTEPNWGCTGCRQCTMYCEHGNEPGLVLLSGRAEATARGAGHPNLQDYPDRFRNRDARLVEQLKDIVPKEQMDEDALVGFWPGCDAIDKGSKDITAAMDLFRRAGADHVKVVDAEQACAGYPLLAAGYPDMFRWHAAKVAKSLARFRTVIVNCSACVHAMRSMYPAEGVSLSTEVLALSEFLAQSAARLRSKDADKDATKDDAAKSDAAKNDAAKNDAAPRRKSVYYHDPCYLARYEGVLDAPRRVLAQVADVREFGWSRKDTECCGGGGLLPKTMPDVADSMARKRLKDISSRGGGTVVTSCATCAFMLKRNAPTGVTVYDLPTAMMRLADDGSVASSDLAELADDDEKI